MSLVSKNFYFDSVFDDLFNENTPLDMRCDIYEKKGKYNIELDIPGFKKEDIKIEYRDGYLTVSAEKGNKEEEKEKNYIKKERTYGKISRQFYIGKIDENQIKANYKDGILKLTVPKEEKLSNKKQITIE